MLSLLVVEWYGLSLAAVAILVAFWRTRYVASSFLVVLRRNLVRFLVYRVAIRRSMHWPGATLLQCCLFSSLLGVNAFCLMFKTNTLADVITRSGIIASINMVPLFLGGRSNMLVDLIGIPLHVHHLFHHWVGRLSIILALIHSGLAVSKEMNVIQRSGWMVLPTIWFCLYKD